MHLDLRWLSRGVCCEGRKKATSGPPLDRGLWSATVPGMLSNGVAFLGTNTERKKERRRELTLRARLYRPTEPPHTRKTALMMNTLRIDISRGFTRLRNPQTKFVMLSWKPPGGWGCGEIDTNDEISWSNFTFLHQIFGGGVLLPRCKIPSPNGRCGCNIWPSSAPRTIL